MKFNDFQYERPDFEAAVTETNRCLTILRESDNFDEVNDAFMEYQKLGSHIQTMYTLVFIRHNIDTRDEFYEAENAWYDENLPRFTQLDVDFKKAVLECRFLDQLKEKYPETYFKLADYANRSFSEAILMELEEENKLMSRYVMLIAGAEIEFQGETRNLAQMEPFTQSTDRAVRRAASDAIWRFFETNEAEFDDIYDQMVRVRTSMARKLGFKTYTEMAYLLMGRLDYNQQMVEVYREQILKSVVPIAQKLYAQQKEKIGVDELKYYDINLMFPDGNAKPIGTPEEILEAGRELYHEMSPETAEFIDIMLDNELMDVLAKPGKNSGGFMTSLPDYKVPFIFSNFNGTSGDVDVLTHEAGHAFQGYQSRDIELLSCVMPTSESCEIHSMSMEFFAWPYIEKFFGDQADKYRYAHLANAVKFLPYGVLVDHFQHEIYNHPEMSKEQRKATWRKLDCMYRPHMDFSENAFADKGTWWYRQGHIFSSPFYYIDYTLAQVCAFQFWARMQRHDPQAWNDYLHICKIGGTKSFLEIVEAANLKSPFEEGFLDDVMATIDAWLDKADYAHL